MLSLHLFVIISTSRASSLCSLNWYYSQDHPQCGLDGFCHWEGDYCVESNPGKEVTCSDIDALFKTITRADYHYEGSGESVLGNLCEGVSLNRKQFCAVGGQERSGDMQSCIDVTAKTKAEYQKKRPGRQTDWLCDILWFGDCVHRYKWCDWNYNDDVCEAKAPTKTYKSCEEVDMKQNDEECMAAWKQGLNCGITAPDHQGNNKCVTMPDQVETDVCSIVWTHGEAPNTPEYPPWYNVTDPVTDSCESIMGGNHCHWDGKFCVGNKKTKAMTCSDLPSKETMGVTDDEWALACVDLSFNRKGICRPNMNTFQCEDVKAEVEEKEKKSPYLYPVSQACAGRLTSSVGRFPSSVACGYQTDYYCSGNFCPGRMCRSFNEEPEEIDDCCLNVNAMEYKGWTCEDCDRINEPAVHDVCCRTVWDLGQHCGYSRDTYKTFEGTLYKCVTMGSPVTTSTTVHPSLTTSNVTSNDYNSKTSAVSSGRKMMTIVASLSALYLVY